MGGEIDSTGSWNWETTPNGVDADASIGVDAQGSAELPGGVGVAFSMQGQATVSAEVTTEDGMVTFDAVATVSVSAQGGVDVGQVGVDASASESYQLTYQVTMPADAFDLEMAQNLDPGSPRTWPIGTTVRFDENRQSGRGLEITFRGIAAGNNVQENESSSMVIERTSETTVSVTTGSTEGIDAVNSLGFSLGPGSVSVGNDTSLSGSTVTTVEFDLSTEEGMAQYEYYVAHGELMPPADPNAPGIVGMTRTEGLDYESVSGISATLGPLSAGLESPGVTFSSVRTTDMQTGESTVVTTLDSNSAPLVVTCHFDALGNEILESRTYTMTVQVTEDSVDMVNAVTGGAYEPGDMIQITFTHPQLQEYIDTQVNPAIVAQSNEEGYVTGDLSELRSDIIEAPEVTPESFMRTLTQNHGQDSYGVIDMLWTISTWSDGDSRNDSNSVLPATVTEVAP